MNNILLTKERIKRAKRLHQAQLSATQNRMLNAYRRSAFEERQKQLVKKLQQMILNSELNC